MLGSENQLSEFIWKLISICAKTLEFFYMLNVKLGLRFGFVIEFDLFTFYLRLGNRLISILPGGPLTFQMNSSEFFYFSLACSTSMDRFCLSVSERSWQILTFLNFGIAFARFFAFVMIRFCSVLDSSSILMGLGVLRFLSNLPKR